MDKTTINKYTEQMRDAREQLERRKPDTILGMRLDLSDKLWPEKREYQNLLDKWTLDLREIYDFISDEVNKGGTSFESKTFIQEATKLVDTYNRQYPEIEALLNINKPPLGDRATTSMGIIESSTMRSLFAWYYIADFCGEVIRTFTPLIDKCSKGTPEPQPKGAPTPKPDYEALKRYFKADFCGYSSGNTDKFKDDLLPLLRQARDGKEAAAIACILYDSKCLNNKKPKSFKPWHQKFCELTNYPFVEYHPKKIRGTNDYTKLLPALYFL